MRSISRRTFSAESIGRSFEHAMVRSTCYRTAPFFVQTLYTLRRIVYDGSRMSPGRKSNDFDVAVVGAGPIGAATALAFARRGARVVIFEANPAAARRLAGEWLHPPGVEVLGRLGLDVATEAAGATFGRGFVVFPDDRSAP